MPDTTPRPPEELEAVPVQLPWPDGTTRTISAWLAWLALGAYGGEED